MLHEYLSTWFLSEARAIAWLQNWPNLVVITRWFTDVAYGTIPFVIAVIACCFCWRRAIILGTIYGLAIYLNSVLKFALGSPRPFWISDAVNEWAGSGGFGMPSGHVLEASVTWLGIAFLFPSKWSYLLAFTLTALMGFSRVYLGVHFFLDVLLGWGIALLLAFIGTRDMSTSRIVTVNNLSRIVWILVLLVSLTGTAVVLWELCNSRKLPSSWPSGLQDVTSLNGVFKGMAILVGILYGSGFELERKLSTCSRGKGMQLIVLAYTVISIWVLSEVSSYVSHIVNGVGRYVLQAVIQWGCIALIIAHVVPLLFSQLAKSGSAQKE